MRNNIALTDGEISKCLDAWDFLMSDFANNENFDMNKFMHFSMKLDVSEAKINDSKTRFSETHNKVFLGADVMPGVDPDPNSQMSFFACLAHELAHAERYFLGFKRPLSNNIDEAETSLHASFNPPLGLSDRMNLIDDAKQRLNNWSYEK